VFGYLAMLGGKIVFQYLFCIANAFQGLLIFILYNIRDPNVQDWWRQKLGLPSKAKFVPATQSTTTTTSSMDSHTAYKKAKPNGVSYPDSGFNSPSRLTPAMANPKKGYLAQSTEMWSSEDSSAVDEYERKNSMC